jgi:hypothetical protein
MVFDFAPPPFVKYQACEEGVKYRPSIYSLSRDQPVKTNMFLLI